MQHTSTKYQELLASWNHQTEVKAVIGGIEYTMSDLKTLETERHPFGTAKPTLGLAVSGEITITAYLPVTTFARMSEINVFIRLTSETGSSEWLPKGTYYIDTREGDSSFVTIHGFDAMMKAEQPYANSTLEWPARDCDVVNEISAAIGVDVDERTWDVLTRQFPIQLPEQYVSTDTDIGDYYTMRETLAGIAGLYGGSFIVNDIGKLQLICPWNRPVETYYLIDELGNYITVGGQRVYLGA